MTIDEKALKEVAAVLFQRRKGPAAPLFSTLPPSGKARSISDAKAAITAYLRAREAQGYVEVPVEPTDEMINDAVDVWHQPELRMLDDQTKDMWRAMIAARPQKEGE